MLAEGFQRSISDVFAAVSSIGGVGVEGETLGLRAGSDNVEIHDARVDQAHERLL